jgi:hypothetical protein
MRRKGGLVAAAAVAVVVIGAGLYLFSSSGRSEDRERFKAMVDQAFAQVPEGYTATYKAIDYAAGRGTVTGISVHKAAPDVADLSIAEVEVTKPNLDFATAWSKAAGDPKALTQDTVITAFDGAKAKGVAIHSDLVNGSFDQVSYEGARLYPWSLFQPGVPHWDEVQNVYASLLKNPPAPPDFQPMIPLLRFAAAAGMAWAVDLQTLENMKATINLPPIPPNPAMEFDCDIRKVASRGQDRGALAEAEAEGISMKMGAMGTGTVERMSIAGYDLHKPMSQLLSAATPAPEMLDGLTIGKIEYAGMSVQYGDRPPIALGRMTLSNIAFSGFVPVSGGLALEGLRVSKQMMPDPRAVEGFDKLGLDTLTFSAGLAYQWDLAQKRLALRNIVFKVDELGALNLAVDVAQIAPNLMGAMQAELAHALLTYDDNSLVDRAIKAAAAVQQRDAASYRTMLVALVKDQAAHFADSPPLVAAGKALVDFIDAPHSLAIELSPPKPVTIMELQGAAAMPPPQLATTLGLSVTANH